MNADSLKWMRFKFKGSCIAAVEGRLIELLSLFLMAGWFLKLIGDGEMMLSRPLYEGFNGLSAAVWITIFLFGLLCHGVSLFWRGEISYILRYVALAWATGLWVFIASNFSVFAPPNMASWTYAIVGMVCFLKGVEVVWNKYSQRY